MKKYASLTLVLLLLLSLLTACGGASTSAPAMDYAVKEEAMEAPMAMDMATGNSLTSAGTGGSTAIPENRKWIITVDMSAETEDLESLLASLDSKIKAMNGYVEDQNIYNGSSYSGNRRYRNANLTIRVPAETVDQFTEEISGIANVVRKQTSKEDVTLSYVDTESRKAALETEEARLLELLAQAETMTDLLEIEARLTEVRYQMESAASRLRTYDNQIDYATIYLYIEEVQEYTPVAEKTVWQRITEGFADSLESLGDGLVDLMVWLIVSSPFLVVYGGIAAVIFLLVRKFRRARPSRKEKKHKTPWNTKDSGTPPAETE